MGDIWLTGALYIQLIRNMALDDSTREGIKMQIKLACDDELPDVVLKLSTEDCFDLACDLVSSLWACNWRRV